MCYKNQNVNTIFYPKKHFDILDLVRKVAHSRKQLQKARKNSLNITLDERSQILDLYQLVQKDIYV